MNKEYLEPSCTFSNCKHFKTCAFLNTEVVYTRNDKSIDAMFIGQGAGKQEQLTHKCFTGPAGKLLREKIKPLLLSKTLNIVLDNTVRCRPLDNDNKNRAPTNDELEMCLPILWNRIRTLKPKVLIPLGSSSTNALIPGLLRTPISELRGKRFMINGFLVRPTFHPAAILHATNKETKTKLDLFLTEDITTALSS